MKDFYAFKYDDNFAIFGHIGTRGKHGSPSQLATLIERAARTTKDAIGLETNSICMLLAANPGLPKFIASFVCLVFPPHSPLVIHDDTHESSMLRNLVHDLTRNILAVLSKVEDPSVASTFGLHETRFMLNLVNLYWRNNEKLVLKLVSSCKLWNRHFTKELRDLTRPLLRNIQKELEHFQFILSGTKQGRSYELQYTFTGDSTFADRCDTSCPFDRNMLYVSRDTLLLDSLAFLETIMQFLPEDFYADVLSTEVETLDGNLHLEAVLKLAYYLLADCHHYILSQNAAMYRTENLPERYEVMFQKCFFYRCKIVSLNVLMLTIMYNVFLNPCGSADFCYNWLLVFTQMGCDDYMSDKSLIIDDLREVDFTNHVDTWSSISKTWKIKEITGLRDEELIRECLEKHEYDVSGTIIDLVNRPYTNYAGPIASTTAPVPPPGGQPRIPAQNNYNFGIPFLPKEERRAVLNYWDHANRAKLYDDDYDDYEDVEGEVVPLNAKLLCDELIESSDYDDRELPLSSSVPTQKSGVGLTAAERNQSRSSTSGEKATSQKPSKNEGKGASTRGARGGKGVAPRGARGGRGGGTRRSLSRKKNEGE
ncbi:hypothetical protein BgAZ_101690 [Babesia gibsoni]|uniref:Uncharacterized protein n=1 Tax=Babesia gibsoni TaxID=33632 RepID=A0AAD8PF41_BABGI|nr:hypothetical protein BgAZ_101690 [Babesia gibsoni]